jgi:hypothetical protein
MSLKRKLEAKDLEIDNLSEINIRLREQVLMLQAMNGQLSGNPTSSKVSLEVHSQ